MMKILFSLLFMIPLCLGGYFWLNQVLFFFLTIIFMGLYSFNWSVLNLSYFMGCDLLSYSLILLSFWICSLMLMASEQIYKSGFYWNIFLFSVLFLLFSLFCVFCSLNVFYFYLFFEISLVPLLFLIVGWGAQPERIQAGFYLMFYTLFASLPMMISLFYLYFCVNSLDFYFFCFDFDSFFMFICMNFVFFIKAPMFLVHLWLPKAHVEAPISGSMVLAGVMLKLGGYGMMRFFVLFMSVGIYISWFFVVVSLLGGFLVALICMRQSDMKSLIAYSSVSHMSLVLAGIFTFSYLGFCGSFVMMIAHGLCSSGLFCLANISYERIGSRSIYLNKGLLNLMPSMSLWWFLFCACNMAAPPSLNLLGEILLISSLVSWSIFNIGFLSLVSFFGAAYSLYLYSYTQHGKFFSGLFSFNMGYVREYLLLFLHWFPLNFLIFKGDFFLFWN
uniref:NADH-ubiquinone oxidoreductase chain 4 n=1 Tax=Trogoderma variabile TaxID=888089 RepID=A0A7D5TUM1_9COLE|nr:NADH dehydrogenase subunit 4 [Trogoderma variabile]